MSKIAFIFPGQGSQYIGMGKELYDNFESVKNIYRRADETLGYNFSDLIFEGNEEDLTKTENTQPAILITSIAINEVLKQKGISPDVVAGLSLGEYSAHVAAGSINFEDAVRLVKVRGRLMQEEVPEGVGTMAAILGLEAAEVIKACKESSAAGIVEPANFNCSGQIVIAGEIAAVEKAVETAKEKGAKRAMILNVSAPFHCSMLAGAGEKLGKELDKINISDMNIPVIANVNAEIVKNKSEIKDLLVKQVSHSVLWEDSVRKMLDMGVTIFIEVGPGKALSGFVKKINKDVKVLNIEDLSSLENTLNNL